MIFKKIRKGHVDWRNFLCSTPARDYVFQKDAYEDQISMAAENIRNADCVIIGQEPGHRQLRESSMAVKGLQTILQNL